MGPGNKPNILQLIAGAEPLGAMRRAYDSAGRTVLLRDMVGGALSVYAAALIARTGGTHVFVAEDRDAAAYLLNDFMPCSTKNRFTFFRAPTSVRSFTVRRMRRVSCSGRRR